jgi:sporulation protein YabP
MPDKELKQAPALLHALQLEARERLSIAGVLDVSGFDEGTVLLETSLGELCIRGEELHIERIDLETGALVLRGRIRELSYDEPARGGLLARIFS